MKLKNQNVNEDGTMMLKNVASKEQEPQAQMEKPSKSIKEQPKERPVERPIPEAEKPNKARKTKK